MQKYWNEVERLIHEEEVAGVPMKVYKERPSNISETLTESVKCYPDKIAVVHQNERLTYRQLQEQVNNAAYQLKYKYGVQKGDRIALLLMNGIPFVVSVYAILQLGAIAVPLNTKLKSQELKYMINNSGARMIIGNLEWWPNLKSVVEETNVEHVFITDTKIPEETKPYINLVNTSAETIIDEAVDEHDSAFIMYTSGTTGRPKGALISHFNMIHTALNYKYCYNLSSADNTVIAVPVFHITGLAAQLVPFIFLGGKAVLLSMFKPKEFLQTLQDEQITHVIASPTVYVMTLLDPDHETYDVSHLRVGGFGGAPMPSETLKALKKWVPAIELHNSYGLTETSSPVVIMPHEVQLQEIAAVGPTVPVAEVKVVDPDTKKELAPGEVGELLFKGPMVIQKYWENEEATTKAIKEGWFSSGDLGVVDEKGIITIKDRIKDMINRGGEKIYSVELEEVLYSNQKIMETAVVGVPDKTYGEVVKACVVPRKGEGLTVEEVRQWIRDRLAKYKVPTYVEIMDVLPRNPNGKVIKTELRYIP
ncbi:MAG: acyl--CoA ligase [Bacillaceae bacterium]|nr:acyl--CoA ligase [Bacillaceae bacterium]